METACLIDIRGTPIGFFLHVWTYVDEDT